MSSATEPTGFYLELRPPLFLYPDFLPLARGGMHTELKNKAIHTHPFGRWYSISKTQSSQQTPAPPQRLTPCQLLPHTPGEEPVCMLDDRLDDPDDLQRDRGHHLRDVPGGTGQRRTGGVSSRSRGEALDQQPAHLGLRACVLLGRALHLSEPLPMSTEWRHPQKSSLQETSE